MSKIEDINDIMKTYDPNENKSKNILSKYERVAIISQRAEQIARGAIPYVKWTLSFNPIEIAKEELRQRKIPIMLLRIMPNGKKEYWRLQDMIILDI